MTVSAQGWLGENTYSGPSKKDKQTGHKVQVLFRSFSPSFSHINYQDVHLKGADAHIQSTVVCTNQKDFGSQYDPQDFRMQGLIR